MTALDEPNPERHQEWWRRAVIYQVYVRSFADGNGDGTGDIAGLRSRLPYLRRLGIDAIWVNPWYRSPLLDGGYDVEDYREINERFGTTDDAVEFIADAHDHGIRVIVDLVPNHTSWNHRWFVEACAAAPGDPARDRYHFQPGRGPAGEQPPNNWQSRFGGSAWTRLDDGEWYLHIFNESQPDVNWEHPEVRAEFESVMRFWLDRGADGFRIDVAHSLVKAPGYPDAHDQIYVDGVSWYEDHPFWDRDEIHPIVRRWRQVLDEYEGRMMVAEAWVRADRLARYLRADEYHQAFDFDLLSAPWDARRFASIIEDAATAAAAVGSSPTWVLSNHDVVRHPTRYGLPTGIDPSIWLLDGPHDALDAATGVRRARAAALLTLALPGSTYVYMGDELGLPEVWDLSIEVLEDPVWEQSGQTRKGRDGCRVPIPWESDGPSYGFGSGPAWLPQPAEYSELAAAAQESDPRSMLALYRQAIEVRRALPVDDGSVEVSLDDAILTVRRTTGLRCVVNLGTVASAMPPGEVVLASTEFDEGVLPPDAAVWLR